MPGQPILKQIPIITNRIKQSNALTRQHTRSNNSLDCLKRLFLAALADAAAEGRGAAQLEGRMIDAASARMAENVVAQAAAIQDK